MNDERELIYLYAFRLSHQFNVWHFRPVGSKTSSSKQIRLLTLGSDSLRSFAPKRNLDYRRWWLYPIRLIGWEPNNPFDSSRERTLSLALGSKFHFIQFCPQEESNLYRKIRNLAFYPLNYGGLCSLFLNLKLPQAIRFSTSRPVGSGAFFGVH